MTKHNLRIALTRWQKLDVGYLSAFGWAVLLCCFWCSVSGRTVWKSQNDRSTVINENVLIRLWLWCIQCLECLEECWHGSQQADAVCHSKTNKSSRPVTSPTEEKQIWVTKYDSTEINYAMTQSIYKVDITWQDTSQFPDKAARDAVVSSPLSGISGLSFDSSFLSPFLFFCLVLFLLMTRIPPYSPSDHQYKKLSRSVK